MPITRIETWPCQGSDECGTRLAETERLQCHACGLYCCATHATETIDGPLCDICLRVLISDGEWEALMLTEDPDAQLLASLAVCGCTVGEARAACNAIYANVPEEGN